MKNGMNDRMENVKQALSTDQVLLLPKLLATAVLTMAMLTACSKPEPTPTPQAALPKLATITLGQNTVAVEHGLDGALEAVNQTVISAQTASRVIALPVDVGMQVSKGQLLVRFKDDGVRAQVAQTSANIKAAQANVAVAEKQYQRILAVFQKQLIPAAQMDKATADRDAALAQLAAARAAGSGSLDNLSYAVVNAPFAGIITRRDVQQGEVVMPGQPLLTLQAQGNVRAVVDVPQQMADAIRNNPTAKIVLSSGNILDASKVTVFPNADPTTHTFKVRAELPKTNINLHDGELVKVMFHIGSNPNSLSIPSSALIWRGEVSGVYSVEGNQYLFRSIRTGNTLSNGNVEVLAGLSAGDTVVVDGVAATSALLTMKNNAQATSAQAKKGE